ncbi:MAG: patatin-like phospholipase family protein [Candidatus Sumerlaeaceae bacterium]
MPRIPATLIIGLDMRYDSECDCGPATRKGRSESRVREFVISCTGLGAMGSLWKTLAIGHLAGTRSAPMLMDNRKYRDLTAVALVSACLYAPTRCRAQAATSIQWPETPGAATVSAAPCPIPPDARDTEKLAKHAKNQPLLPGHERFDYMMAPARAGEPLVLMSISGGGSRSAYYAARVMEELSKMPVPGAPAAGPDPNCECGFSMLDTVRAMSTVSAGGFAAGYYLTHFNERHQPGFYQEFRNAMAVNLQWRTYGHMAWFPPLAIQLLASSVTRTDLLADEIEKLLGGKQITFDHLRVQELQAVDPAPVLLVNGTIYNSGQRLVMTNLPAKRFPSIMDTGGTAIAIAETDALTLHNLVQPLTFEDIGSDVGQFRLAQSIAASAAYPLMLAPVPLRVYSKNIPFTSLGRVDNNLTLSDVAYVADGGVAENLGVDSVLSLLKTLPHNQPVLLLVVDASQRMETKALREGKVWGLTSVIPRMYDIGSMRPLAFYGAIAADFHEHSKLEAVFIRMEGYDEQTEQQLKNIPTSFKLTEKHRSALDAAAVANVQRMAGPLLDAYQRLSAPPPKPEIAKKVKRAIKAKPSTKSTAKVVSKILPLP